MEHGCRFVGLCALASHEWMDVIVGGFAAIATAAAVVFALWSARASKRDEEQRAKALLRFKGPSLAASLAHAVEAASEAATRAIGLQSAGSVTPSIEAIQNGARGFSGWLLDSRHGRGRISEFVSAATEAYFYARLTGEDVIALGLPASLIDQLSDVVVQAEKADRSVRVLSLRAWSETTADADRMAQCLIEIRLRSIALAEAAQRAKVELERVIDEGRR